MRVIIAGGTGLIGRQLTQSLVADGHEIIILSRNPDRYVLPEGVTAVKWDAQTMDGWGERVEKTDVIVNLAGASIAGDGFPPTRWTDARKRLILDSRLNAGKAIVAAIANATDKPSCLIQSSAVGFYGGHRKDEILAESAAAGDDFLAEVVQQWEASTKAVEAMGVRRVIIRTGVVFTADGGALPMMKRPFTFFIGGPLGNGKQWVPWIHMRDEVRAIRFLMENEMAKGAFNLTAPIPLPNKELVKIMGAVLRRPSFMPAPAFALKLLLGEMATIILDGQRAIPQRLLELGFQFTYPTIKPALHDLLGE